MLHEKFKQTQNVPILKEVRGMDKETILLQALKNEQARMETMKIIYKIREMGGTDCILKLAGYILTADDNQKPA